MTHAYHAPAHPGVRYPGFVEPKPPRRVDAPAQGEPSVPARPDAPAFPRVDTPLVRPETREELIRGRLVLAAPALLPHARRQSQVVSVTNLVSAMDCDSATELLTCTGSDSDFATDACLLRKGIDPATGARYLEELVFEVVAEQSLRDITERAQELSARGVRRIIAIFVKTDEVREWSPSLHDWVILDPSGAIEDRMLATPLPVRALLDRTAANRAVVQALKAKQDPAILELEAEGRQEGLAEGITTLCAALGIPVDADRRAHLQSLDIAGLAALLTAIGTDRRWP